VTATALRTRPPARYRRIGDGEHSEVFRRPGSAYCLQLFRPDCPELTVDKIRAEYAYLRAAYAAMPTLVPGQRLFADSPGDHVSRTVLVKQWVDVDPAAALNRVRRADLPPHSAAQLDQFVTITRALVASAAEQETFWPDIIDDRFQNLALDTGGNLRLLDTNRLISTRALRALGPGQTLDRVRRPIHARFLRRLMYLDAAFCGRGSDQLAADPLYRRYLHPDDLGALLRDSRAAGEPP